ncbi:MAG: hypothetical protein IKO05_10900 [Selenomonadaceae bacterium]|nr:hypothetical protein [Selenomonadaceae bacterium]
MKKIFVVALSFFCVMCAGCFQAKSDVIIAADGSVVVHNQAIGNALVIRRIEEWKENNERANPLVKGQVIVDGDLRGYRFDYNYPDIETFAEEATSLYRAKDGKSRGISKRAGWFFDVYDFDFCWTSSPTNLPPEAEFITQEAFNGVEFDVTIQLPYSAEKNNADEISADGKFLKWKLSTVMIHGGEKFLQARFKIWHKEKFALTAAFELLLLAATIFFFRKARKEESKSLAKDFRLKRNIFAGLFVALAIASAYLLLAPVDF